MKIAMIGSRGIGSNYGGIERVLEELCPRLADMGHEVDVFARCELGQDNGGPTLKEALPVESLQVARGARRGNSVRSIPVRSIGGKHLENLSRSMISTIKSLHHYDIVHFHATGPGMLAMMTRATGQTSVVTIHALDQRRQKWGPLAKMSLDFAERAVASCATEVTVVSESVRRYLRERYECQASYIPNGLPRKARVAPGALLQHHGLEPGRYFLFASRLTPEKGCHDLISAFNRTSVPFKLAIAGGTGPEAYAQQLRQLADAERVVFLGHLSGAELAEAFCGAYAFVLPSYIEGMSMALLEAMAFGIPALVSDIEENRFVIGNNGFHFAVGNVDALCAALTLLAMRPDLVLAKARAIANMPLPNWDDVAGRYERIYRDLPHLARRR